MPGSGPDFREDIAKYLKTFAPDSAVIDVGAGAGTYADLLDGYFYNIDACEIYLPYIEQYDLMSKYRKVEIVHARYMHYSDYDIAIFGDVVEHMPVGMAQYVLERACAVCRAVVVIVPFERKQGAVGGNRFEVHQQDDLTPAIMLDRYPMLREWRVNSRRGVYLKK